MRSFSKFLVAFTFFFLEIEDLRFVCVVCLFVSRILLLFETLKALGASYFSRISTLLLPYLKLRVPIYFELIAEIIQLENTRILQY